jgi:formylglycine-generating enzyme required for sulfatase activity
MLIQRAGSGTIPPAGFTPPPWSSLADFWDAAPGTTSHVVTLGPTTVSLGHDDFEADDTDLEKSQHVDTHEFGWDNESPKREVHVDEFRIEWRPVTNGQFYRFYKSQPKGYVQFPASWVEDGDEIKVCGFLSVPFPFGIYIPSGSNFVRSRALEDGSSLANCDVI